MNLHQEAKACQIFKQLNDHNHLSGKFWLRLCTLKGAGAFPNKEEGDMVANWLEKKEIRFV
jgi:hypothetical protein